MAAPFTGRRRIDVVIADIDDPPGESAAGLSGTGQSWLDSRLPPA